MELVIKKANISKDYTVILTKEILDRDEQIIKIDGLDISNYEKNPILIDSHNYYDTIERIIGKIENIQKTTDTDGVKILKGNIIWADTEKAQIAKALVDGGFLKTVSIGFGNCEWSGNICNKAELYEVSLVALPANTEAIIKQYKEANNEFDLTKTLKHYEEIKKKIKVYRDKFMNNDLWKNLEIEKTGDEIEDIITIADELINHTNSDEVTSEPLDTSNPENQQEAPTEETPQVEETIEQKRLRLLRALNDIL